MTNAHLYIPHPHQDIPLAPWFAPRSEKQLFADLLPENFFEHHVTQVADPAEAAAIVLPHNFKMVDGVAEVYIRTYADLGERLGVPVYMFSLGDFTDRVQCDPRVWVFRLSLYASSRGPRDILLPTLTEDLGRDGIVLRPKQDMPTVAFCGYAGFNTARGWIAYAVKNLWFDTAALLYPAMRARKLGVYWRRAAIAACAHSGVLQTQFILRRSFSGHRDSIELPPEEARRQFIQNSIDTDFILAPKGDGNYSNRFLEALSLGRIPVLIDTDVVLPDEEHIAYEQVIVRVPMEAVARTPQYIRAWYDQLSAPEWEHRQRLARELYETYLRQDSFFRRYFTERVQTHDAGFGGSERM